jgi:hypothetical protein
MTTQTHVHTQTPRAHTLGLLLCDVCVCVVVLVVLVLVLPVLLSTIYTRDLPPQVLLAVQSLTAMNTLCKYMQYD